MSFHGDKNLLLKLQGTLLSAGYERADKKSDGFFGTENAPLSPGHGNPSCVAEQERKKKIGEGENMNIKKMLWMILGMIGLVIGAIGAVLPMLPAFPFLLLAAVSFGKSSERLHNWFIGTQLYKKNLESYVKGQGMTKETKRRVMLTVTLLMSFGFIMMLRKCLYIPCAILCGVWVFHIIYFVFCVKTYVPAVE